MLRGHRGKSLSILQHLIADSAALDGVAFEQRFGAAEAALDEREFPSQVKGVLHAGVHALSAGGAVDMSCVAGQHHAGAAVVGHLTLIDMEIGDPYRIRKVEAVGTALVDTRLGVGQRGLCFWSGGVGRPGVGNDAITVAGDGKDCEDSLLVPEDTHLIARNRTVDMYVSKEPVVGLGFARKLQAERMPDRTVGAVATDKPRNLDFFLA